MEPLSRSFAIVTGASTGIGYELARCCLQNNFDVLVVADEMAIHEAAEKLEAIGGAVTPLVADLSTKEGVEVLWQARRHIDRPLDALLANAGRGLGKAFLDQDLEAIQRVVDTNITGTLALLHHAAQEMRRNQAGRILITGSIAGFIPGSYQAVYNGTKAFIDSFSYALREELSESGVTVTCLMPGATETEFFRRADMLDTKVGAGEKDDAGDVAKLGFKAMMDGESGVVTGLKNKMQTMMAAVTPATVMAEMHAKQAAPGTAKR